MTVCDAFGEWQWQGGEKKKILGEKPVSSALRPPQIPHGLPSVRTRSSAVRGRQLATWAAAWPKSLCDGLITISYTVERDGVMQIFSAAVFGRRAQVHITLLFWKTLEVEFMAHFFLLAKTHSGCFRQVGPTHSTIHGRDVQKKFCRIKFIKDPRRKVWNNYI